MNFIIPDRQGLFRSYYIYLDNKNNLSDSIFKDNNIKVNCKKELSYPNSDYKIKFVSICNNKDYLFVKAMCELEDKMIEEEYLDYEEICDNVFSSIIKSKKKVKRWDF